jgi:hypothetical protein
LKPGASGEGRVGRKPTRPHHMVLQCDLQ